MYFPEEDADFTFQTPRRPQELPGPRRAPSFNQPPTTSTLPQSARLFPTSSALLSQSDSKGPRQRGMSDTEVLPGPEVRQTLGHNPLIRESSRRAEDASDEYVVRQAPPNQYRDTYAKRYEIVHFYLFSFIVLLIL